MLTVSFGIAVNSIPASLALETRILPDQWWQSAEWSPDGRFIAVQSPPSERSTFKERKGRGELLLDR